VWSAMAERVNRRGKRSLRSGSRSGALGLPAAVGEVLVDPVYPLPQSVALILGRGRWPRPSSQPWD
jgi:hypothetical protein